MKFPYLFRILVVFMGVAALFIYRPGNARPIEKNSKKQLHIIFDLGGVLIDTDIKSFWYLGPQTLIRYWRAHGLSRTQIVDAFYRTLNNVSGIEGNPQGIRDDHGNTLPLIMCEWLMGTKTTHEIREEIFTAIPKHPEWFASQAEQKLMCNMTNLIFDPTTFAKTRKLISNGVELVKNCKNKGHKVYILSNFDPESFELLLNRYPDFFELFDGIIISGYVKQAKPNTDIFKHFTDQLPAQDCVFIDDQHENIKAARSLGMNAILCKRAKKRLKRLPDLSHVYTRLAHYEYEQPQTVT